MKGLLTKDFRILAGQKRYFTIIILIALIFLCSGQPAQIIVGYCTMFGMLFTVNTISYDEFDHGYLFLFTLPVSRKDYVLENMYLCCCAAVVSGQFPQRPVLWRIISVEMWCLF